MVPLASVGFSNTPIGPFQMTVFASFTAAANSSRLFGPISQPSMSSGIASAFTVTVSTAASIGSGKSLMQTVSTGSSSLMPFASALAIMSLQ